MKRYIGRKEEINKIEREKKKNKQTEIKENKDKINAQEHDGRKRQNILQGTIRNPLKHHHQCFVNSYQLICKY